MTCTLIAALLFLVGCYAGSRGTPTPSELARQRARDDQMALLEEENEQLRRRLEG